jgi:hypothetical protein
MRIKIRKWCGCTFLNLRLRGEAELYEGRNIAAEIYRGFPWLVGTVPKCYLWRTNWNQ